MKKHGECRVSINFYQNWDYWEKGNTDWSKNGEGKGPFLKISKLIRRFNTMQAMSSENKLQLAVLGQKANHPESAFGSGQIGALAVKMVKSE